MNRNTPDGILEAVVKGGSMRPSTLHELCLLLAERTDYPFHVAVEIKTGALLKTVDNEDDAQETVRRLRAQPVKHRIRRGTIVELDDGLLKLINDYLATDWKDGRDPSKLGALNAVAYIGECVVAAWTAEKAQRK